MTSDRPAGWQEQQLWLDLAMLSRVAKMEKLIGLLLSPGNDEGIIALCEELWPEGDGPWENTEELI